MSRGNPNKSSTISTPYGINHSTELSPPAVERELAHKRRITLNGYVRIDGLFDIEAELTDHKTYSFPSDFRGEVTPDLPVHHMIVRVTITKERISLLRKLLRLLAPMPYAPKQMRCLQN